MSIQDKLNNTKSYLRSTRKAILGRGGQIEETAGLQDIADAIYNIPVDNSLVYQTDEEVAYEKIVPNGAEKFAQVAKIGGMSYKSKNSLRPRVLYDSNGATTVNEDGSITVNGYVDAYCTAIGLIDQGEAYGGYIHFGTVLPEGVRIHYSFYSDDYEDETDIPLDGSSYAPIFNYEGTYYHYLEFYSSGTYNFTIYPMISGSTTAPTYEPIFDGLRYTKVTELVSEHSNLFNYDDVYEAFKDNDNIINVNISAYYVNLFTGTTGGNTKPPREIWDKLLYLSAGTYYVYFDMAFTESADGIAKELEARSFILQNGEWTDFWCGNNGQNILNGGTFTMYGDGYCYLRKSSNKKCIISNLMITRTPRADYIPYNPSVLSIHEAIQNIDGYGRGVNAEYNNYIDFERKVFVQRTYYKIFDGTEKWRQRSVSTSVGTNIYRYSFDVDNIALEQNPSNITPLISTHFETVSAYDTYIAKKGASVYYNSSTGLTEVFIYHPSYQTLAAWQSYLAELYASGNPLTIEYALAEPIEIDISAYLTDDNFIEVESGGTITAVNTHNYAVPTTINYITKVV